MQEIRVKVRFGVFHRPMPTLRAISPVPVFTPRIAAAQHDEDENLKPVRAANHSVLMILALTVKRFSTNVAVTIEHLRGHRAGAPMRRAAC